MSLRPHLHATATLSTTGDWKTDDEQLFEAPVSPSSAYIVDSPSSVHPDSRLPSSDAQYPSREAPDDEYISQDFDNAQSTARSPKVPSLPDPSQYPDPYPYKPRYWHHTVSTPTLSSADSASASTRSSAYTNSARSGDYGHVHVALGTEDLHANGGISSDDVAQLLAREAGLSSSSAQSRTTIADANRWSYAHSARSRSSSVGNGNANQDVGSPALRGAPSYDQGWDPVEEKDELGLTSEDETDDDAYLGEDHDDDDEEVTEATSAMMIAEEGRGVIVRGTDGPIVQLQVQPATTHLLIGSSTTPNAVPAFLTNAIPHIATTLLCLDISANFLVALPPALSACICLEELNIASNPLRALPVFLAELTSLRVLIADSTGLSTLPPALSAMDKLHSLSIRRNKMHSLPSWLCLLPSLETLLVDGNPFLGPWKALVEPLLSKVPMTPLYPPSTPVFPLPSASVASVQSTAADTDTDELSDSTSPQRERADEDGEDETIMPPRAPQMSRSVTAPMLMTQSPSSPTNGLVRTRTTPNRAYYDKYRLPSKSVAGPSNEGLSAPSTSMLDTKASGERELRKMKSAGELRKSPISMSTAPNSPTTSPQRPALSHYATSLSSSNLLSTASTSENVPLPKRFASLGASSSLSPGEKRTRPGIARAVWDEVSDDEVAPETKVLPAIPAQEMPSPRPPLASQTSKRDRESRTSDKEETKSTRWGFLKKMSMGKMRTDSPSSSRMGTPNSRADMSSYPRPSIIARSVSSSAAEALRSSGMPQIDVRISTTGALLQSVQNDASPPSLKLPPAEVQRPPTIPEVSVSPSQETSFLDIPKSPHPSSPSLLSPAPTPRSMKRRSFLPIDVSPIPIPPAAAFMSGVQATGGADDHEDSLRLTPSPIAAESLEQAQRREEEKAREARTRALRSVMAYLKDMHDLGLSQVNTMSIYGGTLETPGSGTRSRRPTVVETGRVPSESSVASIASSRTDNPQLRSVESRMGLRNGTTTQTNSVATVATTDSSGSGGAEERKYKDDKSKRARVLREIVETERTYVKGLQELVDIYIKPAAASVNVLSGGSQSVVPSQERKIVFSGLEALFSFHKESFLPALEKSTLPVLRPSAELAEVDADGDLSLRVARAVAHIFVSHAAFMKMYSTYINNFDSSVQRIKAWVSEKPGTPGSVISPSSSTAQLVGLGLTMSAVTAPGTIADVNSVPNNVTPLTSSQRKRIKQYLKRCRMNPRHSQLNLEGYLLLPVQRIPRYRLLLEELLRSCPPLYEYMEDPLDRALSEISSLATNMNEGKREAESRRRLVQWQARIRGRFPSPLVQPHRRLIMDGPLHLTRVVRKATISFEVIDSRGDTSNVQVECLSPEMTPRSLMGVLCNDLLVLCRDPSNGQDPNSHVDLWAVLRMQTLPQPASIVHGNALRLVDNKAILYFDAPTTSDALNWFRAINLHIPASKA